MVFISHPTEGRTLCWRQVTYQDGLLLRPRERLRSIVMSMSIRVSVCLSVCPRAYVRNHMHDLYQIFVYVAYDRGSVLLWYDDDRPHRLSAGRG